MQTKELERFKSIAANQISSIYLIPGINKSFRYNLNLRYILEATCDVNRVGLDVIQSKKKKDEIVVIRQMYCYFARKYTMSNLKTIGELVNRDHATVIHSIKIIENMISVKEQDYYKTIMKLESKFSRQ